MSAAQAWHGAVPLCVLYVPAVHEKHTLPLGPVAPAVQAQTATDTDPAGADDSAGHAAHMTPVTVAYFPAKHVEHRPSRDTVGHGVVVFVGAGVALVGAGVVLSTPGMTRCTFITVTFSNVSISEMFIIRICLLILSNVMLLFTISLPASVLCNTICVDTMIPGDSKCRRRRPGTTSMFVILTDSFDTPAVFAIPCMKRSCLSLVNSDLSNDILTAIFTTTSSPVVGTSVVVVVVGTGVVVVVVIAAVVVVVGAAVVVVVGAAVVVVVGAAVVVVVVAAVVVVVGAAVVVVVAAVVVVVGTGVVVVVVGAAVVVVVAAVVVVVNAAAVVVLIEHGPPAGPE